MKQNLEDYEYDTEDYEVANKGRKRNRRNKERKENDRRLMRKMKRKWQTHNEEE